MRCRVPGTMGEVWQWAVSDGQGWGVSGGDTYGTWSPVADPGELSSLCMRRIRNCTCPKQREDHIIAGRPWAGALLSLGRGWHSHSPLCQSPLSNKLGIQVPVRHVCGSLCHMMGKGGCPVPLNVKF